MENILLIICFIFSTGLGYIPVVWVGKSRRERYKRNTAYLNKAKK